MYQFLCIFGPAAITYLVMHHCIRRKASGWHEALIELICCAAVDAAVIFLCAALLGKAELVLLENGAKELQYSAMVFFASLPVSAVLGVIAAAFRQRLQLRVEVTGKETGKDA